MQATPAQKLDLEQSSRCLHPAPSFMSAARVASSTTWSDTAKAKGWPSDQIHLEYFSGAAQDTSGDRSFEVKIASTGKSYAIAPDKTIVQALKENGIEILTSCEQGVCGTCITRVLEGEPDHRDMYFTDEEKAKNDQFTPCCSRAKSKILVLDL